MPRLTTDSSSVAQAGGIVGVLTAANAYYIAFGGLLALEPRPLFTLPMGVLS